MQYRHPVTGSIQRKLRIEPAGAWQGADMAELWAYRELLYFFVWRDVKVRYKQTVLGAALGGHPAARRPRFASRFSSAASAGCPNR